MFGPFFPEIPREEMESEVAMLIFRGGMDDSAPLSGNSFAEVSSSRVVNFEHFMQK